VSGFVSVGKVRALLAALLLLWPVSCGYRFQGAGEGALSGIGALYVEPFVNRTREVGLEREVTAALRSELRQRGGVRVVERPEEADAVLSGVVRSLETRVVAVNNKDEALVYEIALIVDVSLRRRATDELVWRLQQSRLAETFPASRGAVVLSSPEFKTWTLNPRDVQRLTDIQLTEAMGARNRDRLLERFARQLHRKILEAF
jgi:hypothetical protein